jgi:haloalkane dehalogenase
MHYVREGEGAPVIMVHGNPTWSFFFRDVIRAVAADGGQAIGVDLIGCGLSDKPQNWGYHLEGHIRNLEALIDEELKLPKVSLLLHDWGGGVGMGYAVRHPEKIDRIILMNTAAYLSQDVPRRIALCRCPLLGACLVRGLNLFVEAALRMAPAKPLPDAVKAGYRFPYGNWHDRIATQRFVQDIPLKPSHPSWKTLSDIGDALPLLKEKKISLIWGEKDFCFHMGFFRIWKKIYPDAAAYSFPEASHYLLEDAPEKVIPLILERLKA